MGYPVSCSERRLQCGFENYLIWKIYGREYLHVVDLHEGLEKPGWKK
jgi:hypothetical protein